MIQNQYKKIFSFFFQYQLTSILQSSCSKLLLTKSHPSQKKIQQTMLLGEVRGRRLANIREEQTLRVLVAGEWGRSARFPAPLFATQQHVPVSSTWRWPSTS